MKDLIEFGSMQEYGDYLYKSSKNNEITLDEFHNGIQQLLECNTQMFCKSMGITDNEDKIIN